MRLPHPHLALILTFVLALTLLTLTHAQAPLPPASAPVATVNTLVTGPLHDHLLAIYERAVLMQQNLTQAQQAYQSAIQDWQRATDEAVEKEKLPKGTVFTVDLAKDEVRSALPANPPAPEKVKEKAPPPPPSPPAK